MKGVWWPSLWLFFIIFKSTSFGIIIIPNVGPNNCQNNQYFQFSSLKCEQCGSNQVKSPNSLSCQCVAGSRIIVDRGGPGKQCEACQSPQVVSSDGWHCINCPSGTNFDPISSSCSQCGSNAVAVDRDENGTLLNQQKCVSCVQLSVPSPVGTQVCQRCHQQTLESNNLNCQCPENYIFGGVCLSPQDVPAANTRISWHLHRDHFQSASALCRRNQNFTACQLLGNLCVLLNYAESTSEANACNQYVSIVATYTGRFVSNLKDWPETMPWLFYKDEPTVVLDKRTLTETFSRGMVTNFSFLSYSTTGQFLGIINDPARVLQLCPTPPDISSAAFKFPTPYKRECRISVADLLSLKTVFYDAFLQVNNGKSLYPVPVLVDNYELRGAFPNQGGNRAEWRLHRRIFMVDKVTGRRDLQSPLLTVRYASSVEIAYRLRGDGLIYPPLLKVKYANAPVKNSNSDEVLVSFAVTYEMDATKLNKNIEISVGVLSGVAVVYALFRIIGWRRRQGLQMLDCTSCFYFLVFVCSALVLVFVAVLFVTCLQWLFFLKRQTTVIRVLPTETQQSLIKGLVIAAFVMKAVDVLYILYSQIYVDIFFIDWERPRGSVSVTMQQQHGGEERYKSASVAAPVSIMRTLFVANEWREIQTTRRIKPTLQIVLVLLFFEAVGFKQWTTTDPISRLTVSSSEYVGEVNFCLRFAVVSLLYFVIAVAQWIVFGFIYERFVGDAVGDFIDFCSLSNISVFIMSHAQFGYYIHGRSVHGRSDTNLHELYEQFQREEDNLCGKRGLEPNSDLQTFEMALTVKFRNEYSKIVQPLLTRDIQAARRGQQTMSQGRQNPSLPGSSLNSALEQSVRAYNSMNRFLSSFVEHAIRDNDYLVKDKLLLEKLLRMELQPPVDKTFFYNDDNKSFTSIFLYGQEWSLLLFNMLLFFVIDWASGWNAVLSGVVAYFVDILIVTLRDSLGKKNLANKTMVDERYLI